MKLHWLKNKVHQNYYDSQYIAYERNFVITEYVIYPYKKNNYRSKFKTISSNNINLVHSLLLPLQVFSSVKFLIHLRERILFLIKWNHRHPPNYYQHVQISHIIAINNSVWIIYRTLNAAQDIDFNFEQDQDTNVVGSYECSNEGTIIFLPGHGCPDGS